MKGSSFEENETISEQMENRNHSLNMMFRITEDCENNFSFLNSESLIFNA